MSVLHHVVGSQKPRVNSPAFVAWSMKAGTERTAKLVRALSVAVQSGRIAY